MNGCDFLELEKEKLLNHPLFDDAFVATISTLQNFELDKARLFARLYYPHILKTRLYQACTLGITPDEDLQFAFSEILYDEYGQGDPGESHMEQYRSFMRALKLNPFDENSLIISPELEMYISTMMRITQSENWLAAVAATGG